MSFRKAKTDLLPLLCFAVAAFRSDKKKFLCQTKRACFMYCQNVTLDKFGYFWKDPSSAVPVVFGESCHKRLVTTV